MSLPGRVAQSFGFMLAAAVTGIVIATPTPATASDASARLTVPRPQPSVAASPPAPVLQPHATAAAGLVSPAAEPERRAHLTVIATYPFAGIAGVPVRTVELLQFTSPDGDTNTADFAAGVAWGDGGRSGSVIVDTAPGQMGVIADPHTYAAAGAYRVTVHIRDARTGAGADTSVTGTITGSTSAIVVTPQPQNVTRPNYCTMILATFTDSNLGAGVAAQVNYGDGSPSESLNIVGSMLVTGCHNFPAPGTYTTQVTVTDSLGATAHAPVVLTIVR